MANCKKTLWLWVLILFSTPLAAQLFKAENEAKADKLSSYFFSIEVDQLKRTLINSGTQSDRSTDEWIRIALPDHLGNYKEYLIAEDPAALPEIYNAYPGNKTFKLLGVQDEHIHGVLSFSDKGFEGLILDHNAAIYLEPVAGNMHKTYVRNAEEMKSFSCTGIEDETDGRLREIKSTKRGNDNNIRTYRLAVAAAGEFSNARSNNLTTINNDLNYYVAVMNVFYEYELGIRFTRVTGNELIFTDTLTDGITPGNLGTVHNAIVSKISTSNFDIGHGFGYISSGGSGVANIAAICSNTNKGRGWSSASNNASMIDIVLHEVGHQFGARHSYYGNNGTFCSGGRSAGFGYEPGSGNSLMSYEGICPTSTATCPSTHNITPYAGTFYLHVSSMVQILNTISTATCATISNLGNDVPVVNVPANNSIPKGTPFTLIGSATDNDALTYVWEEYDTDANSVNCTTAHPDAAATSTTAPLFRSFDPSTNGNSRTFPKPSDLVNNVHTLGEILPQVTRNIKMRLTARDGKGGTNWAETTLSVVGTAGPFVLNTANTATTYSGGQNVTLTWSVANTTAAPISCSQVDILWSNDGGYNYNTILISGTANDGSQSITIPNVATTQGRVMVKAVGNYFFDVNNANITVTSGCQPKVTYLLDPSELTADAGDPSLNLNLNFGEKITAFTGTLTAANPLSPNPIKQSASSNTCSPYANSRYNLVEFYASSPGTYSFTPSPIFSLTLFSNSFTPSNICNNYITANIYDAGQGFYGYSGSASLNVGLVAAQKYVLRIGFSGTYNISFSGPGDVLQQGSVAGNFVYRYVIIKDGIIKSIDAAADLSNQGNYQAGVYTVYGLYVSSTANLSPYVNGTFSALQNALNGGTICGLLSGNTKTVTIQGCVPSTVFVTSTSNIVNTVGSLPYVLANACTGDTILFNVPANSTITLTGQTSISDYCVIDGSNVNGLTLSGGNTTRLFEIQNGGELVLKSLRLLNGSATTNGGAFWNKGIVRLSNVILEGNKQNGVAKSFTNTGSVFLSGNNQAKT